MFSFICLYFYFSCVIFPLETRRTRSCMERRGIYFSLNKREKGSVEGRQRRWNLSFFLFACLERPCMEFLFWAGIGGHSMS